MENKKEKFSIGVFPTPIQKLEKLSDELKVNLFIKRDDLSGFGFGGNKIRKLEYLLKEAKDNGYTALLTFGGVQTNHGRQMAACACKFGMKSIIIANIKSKEAPKILSGNLLLDNIFGSDVIFIDISDIEKKFKDKPYMVKQEIANFRKVVSKQVIEMYEAKGEKVYEMPAGGSTPLGVMGYFEAVKEMQEQLNNMNQKIDYVICPSGSNGTFSGLWLGSKYYKTDWNIIGVAVSPYSKENNIKMSELINETSKKYNLGIQSDPDELEILGDYWGNGYDVPDEKTYNTIYRLARTEGILVDPTYSGKGFTAMIDIIEKNIIKENSNVLFIHTGGLPALFSEQHALEFTKHLWDGKDHKVFSIQ